MNKAVEQILIRQDSVRINLAELIGEEIARTHIELPFENLSNDIIRFTMTKECLQDLLAMLGNVEQVSPPDLFC